MNEETEEKKMNVYKTSSIVMAAALVYEKMKLVGLEPIPKRSPDLFYFIFEDEKERRQDLVMRFSSNTLMVAPSIFMDTIRQLKQRTKEYAANNQ